MKAAGDPTIGPGDEVIVLCVHGQSMVQTVAASPSDPHNCRCVEGDRRCAGLATQEDGLCDVCRHDLGIQHHRFMVRSPN